MRNMNTNSMQHQFKKNKQKQNKTKYEIKVSWHLVSANTKIMTFTSSLEAHLHVTTSDEALVLSVTHLKELQGFLLDRAVLGLAGIRRHAIPSPLPRSTGNCWSRHGFGESVAMRLFSRVLHTSREQLICGAPGESWRIPGCSTSEPLSTVTVSHLLATTYVRIR